MKSRNTSKPRSPSRGRPVRLVAGAHGPSSTRASRVPRVIRAEHPWEGLRARAVECVSEISWKVSHMDPEQLARAADQADEALAAQTNDYALQAAIAERRPDLWAALASNPSSYPDLLVWLSKLSDPAVRRGRCRGRAAGQVGGRCSQN